MKVAGGVTGEFNYWKFPFLALNPTTDLEGFAQFGLKHTYCSHVVDRHKCRVILFQKAAHYIVLYNYA